MLNSPLFIEGKTRQFSRRILKSNRCHIGLFSMNPFNCVCWCVVGRVYFGCKEDIGLCILYKAYVSFEILFITSNWQIQNSTCLHIQNVQTAIMHVIPIRLYHGVHTEKNLKCDLI